MHTSYSEQILSPSPAFILPYTPLSLSLSLSQALRTLLLEMTSSLFDSVIILEMAPDEIATQMLIMREEIHRCVCVCVGG